MSQQSKTLGPLHGFSPPPSLLNTIRHCRPRRHSPSPAKDRLWQDRPLGQEWPVSFAQAAPPNRLVCPPLRPARGAPRGHLWQKRPAAHLLPLLRPSPSWPQRRPRDSADEYPLEPPRPLHAEAGAVKRECCPHTPPRHQTLPAALSRLCRLLLRMRDHEMLMGPPQRRPP